MDVDDMWDDEEDRAACVRKPALPAAPATAMDDEKAVGMTTDAKPLPFRVPLTEGEQGLILQMADFTRGYVPSAWTDTVMVLRLIATIAQQAEQIVEKDRAFDLLAQEIIALRNDLDAALNQRGDNE